MRPLKSNVGIDPWWSEAIPIGSPRPQEQAVSGDVERVLGRKGRTFREWAQRHRDAFREIDATVQ